MTAREAADIVAAIAARFPDDPSIQREAAVARRCEAYAWSEVPAGAKAAETRAAAEIAAAIAARFPAHPAIQQEAVEARNFADKAENSASERFRLQSIKNNTP